MYDGQENKTGKGQICKWFRETKQADCICVKGAGAKRAHVYKGQENKTGKESMCTKGRDT